jgi:hypothetical protein
MPAALNPNESDRVRRYTPEEILRQIDEQIERNVAYYAAQSDEVIDRRIDELKQEWSIDRYLQANVAACGFVGSALGLITGKKWILLTLAAFGFFLNHNLTGSDALALRLRRFGLRTRSEIDREIFALKVARGDFKHSAEREQRKPIPVKEILQAVTG